MGIADTIFARLQSTTGSIYHPVGFDSRKQSVKRVPSPGTSQDAVSIHPMHFGSHYHTMLFYSSGLAVTPDERPLSNPGNLQAVYCQTATPVTTPHNWAEGSIYLTGLQLQQPPPVSRSPAKFSVHNTGLLPSSRNKNKPVQCILHVNSV